MGITVREQWLIDYILKYVSANLKRPVYRETLVDTGTLATHTADATAHHAEAIAKSLLTTRGDIIYRNATVPDRLAKGTEGYVLTMGADDPAWSAVVEDAAYDASWDGVTTIAPSKNAVYDKIETLGNGGGATLTVAETEVFNGTSPTSWTDLDLSGTVGSNATLVLLKIICGINRDVAIRKNGDTDQFYDTGHPSYTGYGMALFNSLLNIPAVLMVATDATGKIEWITSVAQSGTIIDIIAYIK